MPVSKIHGTQQIQDGTITDDKVDATIITADGTHAFTGDQSLGSHKITNLATCTSGTDAANKSYVDGLAGTGLPSGGDENQVLTKASGAYFDAEWADPFADGGTTGQFLVKASNDDFDTAWADIDIFAGSDSGLVPDSAGEGNKFLCADGTWKDTAGGLFFFLATPSDEDCILTGLGSPEFLVEWSETITITE